MIKAKIMREPKTTIMNLELLEFFLRQKHKTKRYLFSFARNFGKKLDLERNVEKKDKAVV